MGLKFGFLFGMRNPRQWEKPWPQVYAEMLEQTQAAEELGFDSVWMSEHHSAEDGYCPSTLVAAAAVAARTSTITIGTRLLLLPMHNPVRVAEDAAVVDVISGGRFILGIAVGYVPHEYGTFGVNRRFRPSLMDEGIEIIRRCWTEDKFDYSGKRFTLKDVAVQPKPVQQPGPPIWIGAQVGSAIERVALMGDGFHYVGAPASYALYEEAMRRNGRDPRSIPVFDSRDFWCAEDSDQAWAEAREHLFYSSSNYAKWGAEAAEADGRPLTGTPAQTPEEMRERGGPMLFVGDPGEIIEKFEARLAEVPIDGTIMRVPPGMDHDKVLRQMELLAKEVVPHFTD